MNKKKIGANTGSRSKAHQKIQQRAQEKWILGLNSASVEQGGGKGANLSKMLEAKFPVPYAFIVTADAYFEFIRACGLEKRISDELSKIDPEDAKKLETGGSAIRKLILNETIPDYIAQQIVLAYRNLLADQEKMYKKLNVKGMNHAGDRSSISGETDVKNPLVAVRSSATAEDLPDASFAGQQETYLNVKGEKALLQAVKKCWASLFTDRAIYYREQQGYDHIKVGLASVVQLMVQSEKSGVAFSIDPVTNDASTITIEGILGLGEYIVQGTVTPDHYEVDKKTLKINEKTINKQHSAFVKSGRKNVDLKLQKNDAEKQKVTDDEIVIIAQLVRDIEKYFGKPQDIEWAIQGNNVYIVQSRPITTVTTFKHPALDLKPTANSGAKILISCDPASPGIGTGKPVVLKSPKENDKVRQGDILVAAYTSPDYVPAMKRASAIVTEMGGRTSHAAIVSRELGIPAVVGAKEATTILKGVKQITVNGSRGEVFEGKPYTEKQLKTLESNSLRAAKTKTKTKIYCNLAQPESADRVAKMNVDGIGLLRAEFIVAHIGIHPRYALEKNKKEEYIRKLVEKLIVFAKPFGKRPVVYRATDFRTNEYRHLEGGEKYEHHEENPMIGYRGASRYIKDEDVFAMEVEAIKRARKKGYTNIHLMIPFVRIPEEIRQIKAMLEKYNLKQSKNFKLWMMVEVPSSAIMVEEFIKEGIDGISIGTNDLTMLLLGVDRDNESIAYIYDERRSVVMWALKRVIDAGKKHGITVSICGQAPSDYPELASKLVEWGITSLSVTPDMLDKTRYMVAELEKGMGK